MMVGRWGVLVAIAAGCGGSDVDTLCDADDGPWTLQALASENCGGNSNPAFSASYMENTCRGTLGPLFDGGQVSIASDDVLDRCRAALKANVCVPALFKDWLEATAICNDLIIGSTVTGASCSANEECGGESFCKRTGSCGLCLGQGGSGALCAGGSECRVFPERMARDIGRARRHGDLRFLLEHTRDGDRYRHQSRLGVGGQDQVALGPREHEQREPLPERVIHFFEDVTRRSESIRKGLAHADGLGTLAGKYEGTRHGS